MCNCGNRTLDYSGTNTYVGHNIRVFYYIFLPLLFILSSQFLDLIYGIYNQRNILDNCWCFKSTFKNTENFKYLQILTAIYEQIYLLLRWLLLSISCTLVLPSFICYLSNPRLPLWNLWLDNRLVKDCWAISRVGVSVLCRGTVVTSCDHRG